MPELDPIVVYLGNTGPDIVRRLSTLTSTFDVDPSQQFRLRARLVDGSVPVLDVEMESDIETDEVSYTPQPSDFATSGRYMAWVTVIYGDSTTQDTTEFEILVLEHAPGVGAVVGTIYRAARSLAPVAWAALRGYPDFGDAELQRVVDLAKLRTLRFQTTVADEVGFDPRVSDYIAKLALLKSVLPAAKDFWTDQLIQQTALGNSTEVRTYPDRLASLDKQMDRLKADLDEQRAEVEEIIGPVGTPLGGMDLIGGTPCDITPTLADVEVQMNGYRRRLGVPEWCE